MNRIVVITGASGFVGRHLCAHLAGRGWEVRPLVRTSSTARQPLLDGEAVTVASLHDVELVRRAVRGADAIVHLAGLAHAIPAPAEEEFRRVNVDVTATVAQAASAEQVRRFVFVSTIKVNGERTGQRPFTADDAPAPEDAYGRSKWLAEQALTRTAAQTALESVIIRPPLVYGRGVRANVARLVRLVERGWPLPFGAIHNRRTMVSVWNLCDLIGVALEHPRAAGQIFLAGDARPVSTPELIRLIAGAIGRPARLVSLPVEVLRLAGRITGQSEVVSRLVDSLEVSLGKTESTLAWRPPLSVDEGIQMSFGPAVAERPA